MIDYVVCEFDDGLWWMYGDLGRFQPLILQNGKNIT